MSLVEARLRPFIDLYECLETFDAAFDIDTAVGEQLDIIGEYVGIKRLLTFQPLNAPALLSDFYYRILLKARISLNNWNGTTEEIMRIWQDVFPDYIIQIVDNQDMSMLVRTYNLQSYFVVELIQHGYFNPKPMGVRINYEAVTGIVVTVPAYYGAILNTSTREVFHLVLAANEIMVWKYNGAVLLTSEKERFDIPLDVSSLQVQRTITNVILTQEKEVFTLTLDTAPLQTQRTAAGIVSTSEKEVFGLTLNARLTARPHYGLIISTTEREVF
jgi:hypothetical protein